MDNAEFNAIYNRMLDSDEKQTLALFLEGKTQDAIGKAQLTDRSNISHRLKKIREKFDCEYTYELVELCAKFKPDLVSEKMLIKHNLDGGPAQQQRSNTNHFDFGSTVSPDRFYGRKKTKNDIRDRLGAVQVLSSNLVGWRRMGKSSILRYIQEKHDEFCPNQKPLIINMDFGEAKCSTPAGVLATLRLEIINKTGAEPWLEIDNKLESSKVNDGLQKLKDEGHRLIIMLDKFEKIKDRTADFKEWGSDWRSKAAAGLFGLVLVSNRPQNEIYKELDQTSPFSNICSNDIIGPLETDAWQKLVRDSFAKTTNKPFKEAYLEWIDDLAGGWPFYIKMAGSMLCKNDDLDTAKNEFMDKAESYFEQMWEDLRPVEKDVVKMAPNIQENRTNKKAIKDLKNYGILRKDGRLFSTAFAEFVKELDEESI